MTGKVLAALPETGLSETWLRRFDAPERAELSSLATESDPELYLEGLYSFALRQEQAGREEIAAEIYSQIQTNAANSPFQARASQRLDALQGRGSNGARAEVLLRQLTRQSSEPTALLGMLVAGSVFRMTRFTVLSRLAGSTTGNILTRGFGARALAGVAGFALEAPAFTLTQRLAGQALGREQDWSASGLRRDLASSFLVLGGLKLAGWAGASLYRRSGASSGLSQTLFHQGATLGGIYLGHGLEQWTGLRPHRDGATTFVDSLATLLQFHVVGRFGASVSGEGVARWERGLDLRTEILARENVPSRVRLPQLAAAPAGGGLSLPNVLMMTSGGFDPKISGGVSAVSRAPRPESPVAAPDPVEGVLQPRIPRTRESGAFGDGSRLWNYELVMRDLDSFLRPGADHVVATRNGGEIRLRLTESDFSAPTDDYIVPGVPRYRFEVSEGTTRGQLTIYVEPGTLHLFHIRTRENNQVTLDMAPGAGAILTDWLATQAALRGQLFSVLGINNPRIFRILQNCDLLAPRNAMVEARVFKKPYGSSALGMAPLTSGDFLTRHAGKGYFNVHGRPNPDLLPATLRSASVLRETSHPYELQVDPLRDFLIPGTERVIARRDGGELRARVLTSRRVGETDRLSSPGNTLIEIELLEGGQGGLLQFFMEPGKLVPANLITNEGSYQLPRGAGTIVMDWLATQASVQGLDLQWLNVKNPQVIRILMKNGLMTPERTTVEAGYWDFVYDHFDYQNVLPYSEMEMLRHYQGRFVLSPPVLQISGRPNSRLIPVSLRPNSEE
ncbi:MAG: hypothetical protein K8R69_10090 [Deltaproteobacteria bacterium]|nr:hypothetical protein [Deltaproteobacteria bacterium]